VANLIDIFIIQFRRSFGYASISLFDLDQIFYTTILVNPYSAWYYIQNYIKNNPSNWGKDKLKE